ncbi:hypothetical protein MMC09_006754 [Bachmanniomyces sp. S44760]|nr:hypothetical protein [Bachmanniomyces sp. S44760]
MDAYFALLFALLFIFASRASSLCYTPNGGATNDVACTSKTTGASVCCSEGFECLSNGLCMAPKSENVTGTQFIRGTCTDKTWKDTACGGFCTEENPKGGEWVMKCSEGRYCCSDMSCCSKPGALIFSLAEPSVAATAGIYPTSTSSTSSSSSPTSKPTSSTHSSKATSSAASDSTASNNTDLKIGVGIGVAVGILLVALIAVLLWQRRRRRQIKSDRMSMAAPAYALHDDRKSDPWPPAREETMKPPLESEVGPEDAEAQLQDGQLTRPQELSSGTVKRESRPAELPVMGRQPTRLVGPYEMPVDRRPD